MNEAQVIPHACPVCKGDVSGNDSSLYFCKHCNLLFRREALEQ